MPSNPRPRVEDRVRARLLETVDRKGFAVTVSQVDELAHAAVRAMLECGAVRMDNRPPALGLSDRALDVLEGMGRGLTNAGIAAGLGISEETVRTHVAGVLARLGAHDRTHAVVLGLARGILSLNRLIDPCNIARTVAPPPGSDGSGRTRHGTIAGYEDHLRNGSVPCRRCNATRARRANASSARTPADVLKEFTVREGKHLVWVGPTSTVKIHGCNQTPARTAWLVHADRPPEGQVLVACDRPGCVRLAHLQDARDRRGKARPRTSTAA